MYKPSRILDRRINVQLNIDDCLGQSFGLSRLRRTEFTIWMYDMISWLRNNLSRTVYPKYVAYTITKMEVLQIAHIL